MKADAQWRHIFNVKNPYKKQGHVNLKKTRACQPATINIEEIITMHGIQWTIVTSIRCRLLQKIYKEGKNSNPSR